MLVPLILGALCKTFYPEAGKYFGSFTNGLVSGTVPILAVWFFCMGATIDLRATGTVLRKSGNLVVVKTLIVKPGAKPLDVNFSLEKSSDSWKVYDITVAGVSLTCLSFFAIAASLNGFLYKKIHWVLRLVLAIGGLGMMIPGTLTDVVGLALVAAVIVYQKLRAKKNSAPQVIE